MSILVALTALTDVPARPASETDWRALIRPRDRTRVRDWREVWVKALAQARTNGAGPQIAAEGVLLQPDAATTEPDVPDGDYRCRMIKLGAARPGDAPFAAGPSSRCRITGGRFAMLTGAQRPAGRLWRLDGLRLVFLGAVALGDESGALDYARDPDRDAAGILERIGDGRWRLVLPRPQWQSMLDVIELVPGNPA